MSNEFQPPRVVYIEWVDSCATHGWVHPNELHNPPRIRCITTGFLVRELDEGVTVSASWSATGNFDSPITIPWVAIMKYEILEDTSA